METGGSGGRLSRPLVALSSAAILAVYAVGYVRTQAADQQLASPTPPPTAPPPSTASVTQPPSAQPTSQPTQAASTGRATSTPTTATPGSTTPAATPVLPPTVARTAAPVGAAAYRDGTYVGVGTSRHGSIEATVQISGGRIVSADVTQCLTRYSCSRISRLFAEPVAKQAAPVDIVSGATDSSRAYASAVANALSHAR